MKLLTPIFLLLLLGATGCDNGGGEDSFVITDQAGSVSITSNTTPPPSGGGTTGTPAALVFNPPSPLNVVASPTDVVIQAIGTPPGGFLAISNIVSGGTGGSFNLGPQTDEFTFSASILTGNGTASCAVTYIPPDPFTPVTQIYVINAISATTLTFSPPSPQTVNLGGSDLIVTATGTPAGGAISLSNIITGGTGGTFNLGPGANDFTFTTSTATLEGTASCDVTYTPLAPNIPITATYTVTVESATSVTTGPIAVAIPDVGTATSTLPVPFSVTITEVRILLDITHSFFGDLSIVSVSSPASTSVSLFSGVGGTASGTLEVIFDDTAPPITTSAAFPGGSPVTGFPSFSPEGLLASFSGEDTLGSWVLTITDAGFTYVTFETINEWALAFNGDTSIF